LASSRRSQLVELAQSTCEGTVRFRQSRFEDWSLERGAYDLVFAAQSFHWVDPKTGYEKAGEALRGGGTLALFWNRPRTRPSPLQARLAKLYATQAPGIQELPPEVLAKVEEAISGCIAATNLFSVPQRLGFPWSERLATSRYVALLETYSAHATLPEAQRRNLLEGVAELVNAAGGEIEVHYETIVHLARRA
jgi:SAM-dependent methyltransferase